MALTINFMPVYAQAPAALAALKADVDAAVRKAAAEGARVVLPADEPELCDAFEAAGVAVARADASFGYVYGNDTAVARLFAGEKPIPSAVTGSASDALVGGEAWLRGEGAPKLVYVNGATEPVELPAQVSVAELAKAAGVEDAKAVYLGFPQGDMVAASTEGDVLLASDVVRVFGADCCMADELLRICREYRHETCGHCVFGHEGSYQMATILEDVCHKRGKSGDLELLQDLAPMMEGQSLCEVGRVLAKTVRQTCALFGDEISAHYARKVCPAGACDAYKTFHILVSRCTGCGDCLDACEDGAIMGKANFVHVIDQRKCTQCGRCLDACGEGAVVKAGAKKPKTPPRPIPVRRKK
jgi:NADH-quinone oxidoreductase subunit F